MRYGFRLGPLFVLDSTRKSGGGGALFVLAVLALALTGWVRAWAGDVMAWVVGIMLGVIVVLVVIGNLVGPKD